MLGRINGVHPLPKNCSWASCSVHDEWQNIIRRAHDDQWTALHAYFVPSSKLEGDIFIIIEELGWFWTFALFACEICIALDAFYPCGNPCFKNRHGEVNLPNKCI